MRYLLMFIPLLIGTVAPANADCSVADKSFAAFIQAFKNDRTFQLTRIDNPLPWTSTEPDANGKMASQQQNVSVQALSQRSISIIRGNDSAAELSGGEGQLCEQGPTVKGARASLTQYSCNTDVYADQYQFVLRHGCWQLQALSTSGG
jgi:hypothetical protein